MTCTIKVIQVRNYRNCNNKIYYEKKKNSSYYFFDIFHFEYNCNRWNKNKLQNDRLFAKRGKCNTGTGYNDRCFHRKFAKSIYNDERYKYTAGIRI